MNAQEKTLNLGCGRSALKNAVNLDKIKMPGVDIVHDLERMPWPFGKNSFDRIIADNILEHLDDIVSAMEEIHRIGKPGAIVEITVPYFASHWAFRDPTHKHFFAWNSFDYFTNETKNNFYSTARFRIEKRSFGMLGGLKPTNWLIKRFAEAFPRLFERYLSFALKCDTITFLLRVEKDG